MRVSIIDRAVIKEMVSPFFMGLSLFTVVLLTNAIIRLLDLLIGKGIGLRTIAAFLVLSMPHLMVLTIPMSVLLAILIGFGRMSADSEITALKASGVSLYRLFIPVLLFATIAMLATLFLFIDILPRSNMALKKLRFDIIRTRAVGIKPHIFNADFEDLVIYVDAVDEREGSMKNIFISNQIDIEDQQVILAQTARKIPMPSENRIILRLNNGTIHSIPFNSPDRYSINPFELYDLSLDMNILDDVDIRKGDREMTIRELRQRAEERKNQNISDAPQWVEIHKKFSIPFACLVFAVLGLPLGITSRRSGKSVGLSISIGLFVIYYTFLAGGEGLGDEGKLPAWFAMWAPNLILGGLGVYLLVKSANEAPFRRLNQCYESLEAAILYMVRTTCAKFRLGNTRTPHSKTRNQQWKHRFPRILDIYVSREFLKMFAYTFLAMIAISLIVHLFERIDEIFEYNASLMQAIAGIVYRLPFFAFLSIHYATLVSTIVTIGAFSRTSELVAMMASGVSYPRIAAPILVLALGISGFAFILNERIVPRTNQLVETTWDQIKNRRRSPFIYNRRWYKGENGSIFYIRSFDAENNVIKGISLFRLGENSRLKERMESPSLQWRSGEWHFDQARSILFDQDGTLVQDKTRTDSVCEIHEKPEDFAKEIKDSEEMNRQELGEYIRLLQRSGFDASLYQVDWYTKLSLPFLSFIMALIGIPFAYQSGRSAGLIGVGISLFIGIVYFIIFRVGVELGHAGKIPPMLSAWIANLLFFFSGAYLLVSSRR